MRLPSFIQLDARHLAKVVDFSTTSSVAGRIATLKLPTPVLKQMIEAYVKLFHVDMSEAARSVEEYHSFGDFFARELKPGARPVDPRENVLVSPADGLLHNCGDVCAGTIEQIKGKDYPVALLLEDAKLAAQFERGSFATIYLSPANYHRVHSPLSGSVMSARYMPGALYSVQPFVTAMLDNLFLANERIAIHMETPLGRVCVVMVAATIVGRVVLTFSSLETNGPTRLQKVDTLTRPFNVTKGGELGAFHIGSTVVMLMEQPFDSLVQPGNPVRMGQALFSAR